MKNQNHIVILVGVCGTGKSAIGQKVADRLEVPFYDADLLPASKEGTEGQLLQDLNLEKWLVSIKELILAQSTKSGCVISCSVLKKEHRKKLMANINQQMDWVFMNGSYELVAQRVEQDGGHERSASMLKSDFEALEVPKRALTVDMSYSEQDIVDTILKYLARKYG
ncbi:MAG: AAA family ATPase [Pricia sp.]|nr:AAA family ATPase [Pricia sp.]